MSVERGGTVTLVFTDIEESTRLLSELGSSYAQTLADHNRLVRDAFAARGGIERGSAGDGMYFTFPAARAAVTAAVDAQRALIGHEWPSGVAPRVRMGLHTGEPSSEEAGLVGLDVHRAARISSAAHGGQILVSQTVRDLLGSVPVPGVTFLDLGAHELKDFAEPQRLFQAVAEGLPSQFPALRTGESRPNNLPRQLTSFVGRENEIADARRSLAGAPLVTLTGPGGVGKTRLAVEIARELLDQFSDGVWLVELGNLADEALVLPGIAEALGVTEQPGRSTEATLLEHLRTRRLCLVLDNCEHLLDACAGQAFTLLRGCPTLKILATSREALGVAGETVLSVASLPTPEGGGDIGAEEARRWEAVRLFEERAAAATPGFRVTDENARAVVQICQRLDGIPLALELAAARVRALPVEQIATRLDDRFRLLTGGSRGAVTRHQTLRATIDWSYQLLSTEERAVFRRLSVFAGGCTLAAAEAVCAGDDIDSTDVLDVLSRLVDKSLVVSDASAAEARFQLLETMRQYARERLVDAGEAAPTLRRHRDFFLAIVEQAKPAFFRGPAPARWLAEFDREDDNLRVALDWSTGDADGAQAGLRLAAGLWRYWEIRGHLEEGRRWLERALVATDGEVSLMRANALTGAGVLAQVQGDYPAAARYHEESLAQHRSLGNASSISYAAHNLANVAAEHGDYTQARALYQEGVEIARGLGDRRGTAIGLITLGDVLARMGELAEAEPQFVESVTILDEIGDRWGRAYALDSWAGAMSRAGDLARARDLHEEALAISRELQDERGVARTIMHLADLAAREGDKERARALHRECLRIRQALRDMPGLAVAMERLALVEAEDATVDAARLLGAAQQIRETVRTPIPAAGREDYERAVRTLAARLGQDRFEAARLEGRALGASGMLARVLSEPEAATPGPEAVAALPGTVAAGPGAEGPEAPPVAAGPGPEAATPPPGPS